MSLRAVVAGMLCTGTVFAAIAFADGEPLVSIKALKIVEDFTNMQFSPDAGANSPGGGSNDTWEPLGDARGTYLPGFGALFTFEMSLVNVMPLSPFHPVITPQEVKDVHTRKIKKLVVLKSAMQGLIVKAASSLTTLPPTEQITFEAFLDSFPFEDRTGLPRRLTMTANRQKILDAVARHATPEDLMALLEIREE